LQSLEFSLAPGAPVGAVINPASGVFSWTPPQNHPTGPVVLTVNVRDNGTPARSASQSFQVTVTKVNSAPIAGQDSIGTVEDTPVSFSKAKLMANDSDPDRDPLVMNLTGLSTDQGGQILLAQGILTYTPPSAFSGTDTFRYNIQDTTGEPATGTVTVTVSPRNQPGANRGSIAVLEDGIVRLFFVVIPGFTYTVQASTDLVTWVEIGKAEASGIGELIFDDARELPAQTQFYRLVYP
jgi:hypothetical protein